MFSEGALCEAYACLLARLGLDESYSSLLGGGGVLKRLVDLLGTSRKVR